MTMRLAPPYVYEPGPRLNSRGWHRLPSTAWFGANVLLSGTAVVALIVDEHSLLVPLIVLAAGFAAAIGSFVVAIRDALRQSKPIASVINLVATVVINPYTALGCSVWLGVLDFG